MNACAQIGHLVFTQQCILNSMSARPYVASPACHFTTIHLLICRLKPVFAERSSGNFSAGSIERAKIACRFNLRAQFLLKGIDGFTKCRHEILRGVEAVLKQTKIFDDSRHTVLDGHIMDSASRLPEACLTVTATPTFKGFNFSEVSYFMAACLAHLIVKKILRPERIDDFDRNPLGESFAEPTMRQLRSTD